MQDYFSVNAILFQQKQKRNKTIFSSAMQTLAWLGLPLGVLLCAAAGGVFIHWKRKRNKDLRTESGRGTRHLNFHFLIMCTKCALNVTTDVFSLSAADELSVISMVKKISRDINISI